MSKTDSRILIVRLFGGLGNQLFAYAAARRLALVNDADLILDHISGFRYDSTYQRHFQLDHFLIPCRMASAKERLEPFSRIRRHLMRRLNHSQPFEERSYIVQEGFRFDSRLIELRKINALYLEGYWQSEGYFKDVEQQIRRDLQIIPPKDSDNISYSSRINQHLSIAVHVRFFDEPSAGGCSGCNVSARYYGHAVSAMDKRAPNAHYYLFSDRPEYARSLIPLPDDRITLVRHNQGEENSYADLWLMSQCQHFIIANSTFSWWGAWLSANKNKIVVAPKLGDAYGDGWECPRLLPQDWIQL